MSQNAAKVFLGAILVAMVTGAPSVSRDQVQVADQMDMAVDRAKRADETIVFGNQQNKARVVSKRADLADLDLAAEEEDQADAPAQGELDKGSEVIVHKETPVEKDLADRADAARKDFEDQDKIADAMEAAMESVDNMEKSAEPSAVEPAQSHSEQPPGDEQNGASEASEAGEVAAPPAEDNSVDSDGKEGELTAESESSEDADIKDLLQVTSESEDERQTTSGESAEQEGQGQDAISSEAEQYSQTSETGAGETSPRVEPSQGIPTQPGDSQQLGDWWRKWYQSIDAYPGNARLPFDLYRRRRSSKRAGSRRIKRDLLDDVEYDPAWIRYLYALSDDDGVDAASDGRYEGPASSVLDMGDSLLTDRDDYIPLTDSDAEDLYNELEEYLQWELQRQAGAERLREVLGLPPPTQEDFSRLAQDDEDLGGYYGGDAGGDADEDSLLEDSASDRLYPDMLQYSPDSSSSYFATNKRSDDDGAEAGDYALPMRKAESKRYFFPFADEPETHWGAFVPEKREMGESNEGRSAYLDDPYLGDYTTPSKRDYNEAISRLQRLAMALSDNRGPYYTELVQDTPYKK